MERFGLYDQTLCEVRGISVVLSVLTDAHCSKGESARLIVNIRSRHSQHRYQEVTLPDDDGRGGLSGARRRLLWTDIPDRSGPLIKQSQGPASRSPLLATSSGW